MRLGLKFFVQKSVDAPLLLEKVASSCHIHIILCSKEYDEMSLESFVIKDKNLPEFGTAVLQHLDFKTLVKCRPVNREWRDLIDTFLWDRLLASQIGQKMKSQGSHRSNLDIIQLLLGAESEASRMGIARIYLRQAF